MTQDDKSLLLKDLCARLPYGVVIAEFDKYDNQIRKFKLKAIGDSGYLRYDAGRDGEQGAALYSQITHGYCKPYLRSMSSMTDEERKEFSMFTGKTEMYVQQICLDADSMGNSIIGGHKCVYWGLFDKCINWLLEHHFDYRGLIEKGLAIEAPEGMYKNL